MVVGDFWCWGSFVVIWVGDFCSQRLLVGELGWRLLVVGGGVGSWCGDFWWERRLQPAPSLTEQPTSGTLEQPTSGTLHPIPAHVRTLNKFVRKKEIYREFVLDSFYHILTSLTKDFMIG